MLHRMQRSSSDHVIAKRSKAQRRAGPVWNLTLGCAVKRPKLQRQAPTLLLLVMLLLWVIHFSWTRSVFPVRSICGTALQAVSSDGAHIAVMGNRLLSCTYCRMLPLRGLRHPEW